MITLDRLVNVLGGYGVAARLGAVPRSAELRRVVIPEPAVTGDVMLAIGADSAAQALGWARDAGAVAVVVRKDVPDDADDIAVLTVDPAVPWSELAAVVYGLVLEGRETESGRGPTDLFALADSLADAIGAPVVIEGRRAQVLAYSPLRDDADEAWMQTILARRAPDKVRESYDRRGVFAHLNASDEPLFVPPDPALGGAGRMVAAARVGRELLGSVWVITDAEMHEPALRDGARTVALHLLRSRASADLERQVESEAVLRLLDGAADAVTVASRLGLGRGALRVIALRASMQTEPHTALLVAFERATSGFGWSRPGRTALAGNTVYTVLPCDDADVARRWVGALRDGLPRGTAVVAGISGPAGVGELASARREADECLALHELDPHVEPPAYDESWDDVLLQRLRTVASSGRGPSRGPIAELRRHDAARGTPYVETLRAWLEAHGDPVRAGVTLGVHENTVRYRLRKMAEITSVDFTDGRKRVALMIELAALS
ncbi:MAG: helix-turn-helix domain-containing protein [Mycobacterium sp.]|nr:helix-turn-helix domain-containing protein [Mycobacterium sp.]